MQYKDKDIKEIFRHLNKCLDIKLKNGKTIQLNAEEGQKEYKRLHNIRRDN